ncbi:MAG: threonyl-tRNA synthetase editing domain-containing protein [Candidatus Thorarchaeota archaeon]|nr:MAG: hypothetical protein DRO87_10225 [Candidatus Thorarchaeota archaeon]RLI56864.1 MAG: hypothetical protein DRP09_04880 [Candidatus Thorarchaeota archaeon]
MRLLMFHVDSFWYKPEGAADADCVELAESLLVWIHSEPPDAENQTRVLRKMLKNIKWLAQKVGVKSIILHSFAHLDENKAEPEVADALIEETGRRLRERDFDVHIVPFGRFYEFSPHVKGPSLAKVFKHIT